MLFHPAATGAPVLSPYRVVLIHPSAGVNLSGGAEVFSIEMARQLSEHFEVELLSGADCGPWSIPTGGIPRTRAREFFEHPKLAPLWKPFVDAPEIWSEHLTNFLPCLWHLLRRPADLIFPNNDIGGLAVACLVRALSGTPVLFTEHCGLVGGGRLLERNLGFRPDHLVALSEEIAERVRSRSPQQSVAVIPNGVDLARFSPHGDRADLGLEGPVVLCVASLWQGGHKRVHLAIEAVSRLSGVSLLICGDGRDLPYFAALGEQKLGAGRFRIATFPYAQMPAVYRACRAFTLPSIDEPWGLCYLEAMASGLGVVATDDAVRRLIVGDGGLLCDVTDVDTYAAALRRVLAGDWRERAQKSATRFGWERVALAYRDVMLELIGSKKLRPAGRSLIQRG
ncbi:MAG: glycosyltransferase family 4 protein [Aphanocapsa lilacina HA4352-LM1]|nr:glycosyltransferase family 4 protein [Aphanocapsa lilacina HA4352-LM1]